MLIARCPFGILGPLTHNCKLLVLLNAITVNSISTVAVMNCTNFAKIKTNESSKTRTKKDSLATGVRVVGLSFIFH